MVWSARRPALDWRARRPADVLAVGVIALLLQQVADLAVGFGLRGMTLSEQWSYFATPPGFIYGACSVLFVLMPLLRRAKAMGVEA